MPLAAVCGGGWYYKPGVGLFSRTVRDQSGKVLEKLDLVPAK